MNKLEEVKKILLGLTSFLNLKDADKDKIAKAICSLFEPKPDEGRLLIQTLDPKAFTDKVLTEWEAEIRADERAKWDKEKAEFGLSVHEAAVAITLKEVGEWIGKWLRQKVQSSEIIFRETLIIWIEEALKKGEMPQ